MGFRKTATQWASDRWQWVTVAGFAISAALLALFALSFFVIVPAVVEHLITKKSELVEGSDLMERWKNPSMKTQFKVFALSVNNSKEVLEGAVPAVEQSGPYVFDKVMRHEITASGNGTVTFRRKVLFFFNELDSCPSCSLSNRVRVPNILYQKFVELASRPATKPAAAALLAQSPFIDVNVGDLLFNGYKDPFLADVCGLPFVDLICKTFLTLPDRFGIFYGINNTYYGGEYTVKDGTENIRERGEIVTYDGKEQLKDSWWTDEGARQLKGVHDFTLAFHPFMKREDAVSMFSSYLCRTVSFLFTEDTEVQGIPTYRFRIPASAFDPKEHPGFCHATDKVFYRAQNESEKHCYPRGIMQVAKCRKSEPSAVLSMPNFHTAPEEVQRSIEGLNATESERDAGSVDVEPTLGTPLRAHRALQFNVEFWAGKDIMLPAYHTKQRSALIPLVIVHEDSEMTEEIAHKVRKALFLTQIVIPGLCFVVLLTALVVLVATVIFALKKSEVLGSGWRNSTDKTRTYT